MPAYEASGQLDHSFFFATYEAHVTRFVVCSGYKYPYATWSNMHYKDGRLNWISIWNSHIFGSNFRVISIKYEYIIHIHVDKETYFFFP